ncbi:MAG: hypothetical protein LC781_07955 [Actinobacteria bacterium]|nr:hypothetical protein [Actinomycetota bacterium]
MSRTATSPPTDGRLWRLLLARTHPDAGGTDDLLVVETLRAFGQSESKIWALLQEWCEEFDRDAGEVFEHIWTPGPDNDEEGRG